jgi:6-phosphogluconolactonase
MSKPRSLAIIAALAGTGALLPAVAGAQGHANDAATSVVYTMSNAAGGNSILAFAERADGSLEPAGSTPTGGLGTGAGLGNQGGITVDRDFLYVVNAGSDDVSVFRVADGELALTDRVPSGGDLPVSVTVDRGVVYVLNAGSDSIAGFTVDQQGQLAPLPGSVQALSGAGVGAAEIHFSGDGHALIVTEKATSSLVTFPLDRYGVPVDRKVFASPGMTPFGFATGKGPTIYVSEAAGGAAGASSVTSWRIGPQGELSVITPSAAIGQSAACWAIVTPDGRFAYIANTGSGTVSALRITGGALELIGSGASASTGPGSAPIDIAITAGGRYLHVLSSGTDTLATFAIGRDGSLTNVGEVTGLPHGANGLAAH